MIKPQMTFPSIPFIKALVGYLMLLRMYSLCPNPAFYLGAFSTSEFNFFRSSSESDSSFTNDEAAPR